MVLNLQLKSLVISFVYGIILAYLIRINSKYLFTKKVILKIIVSVLFVFDYYLLYFIMLKIISNGMFHIYFIFVLIGGYIFGYYLINKAICKL